MKKFLGAAVLAMAFGYLVSNWINHSTGTNPPDHNCRTVKGAKGVNGGGDGGDAIICGAGFATGGAGGAGR